MSQRFRGWHKRSPLNPYWLDRRKLHASVASLAREASGVLLDVGCSNRPHEAAFLNHVDRYIGLEYPPTVLGKEPELWELLERAQGKVHSWGDGRRLPFRANAFDTVLFIEVLEHVPSPAQLLAEAARVVKPGGHVLATVPFSQPLHELPEDYYRFTPSALQDLTRSAGLEIVQIAPRGNLASATGSLVSQFLFRASAGGQRLPGGGVSPSRWRQPLLSPLFALVQLGFGLVSHFTSDTSMCQGFALVARKPVEPS